MLLESFHIRYFHVFFEEMSIQVLWLLFKLDLFILSYMFFLQNLAWILTPLAISFANIFFHSVVRLYILL